MTHKKRGHVSPCLLVSLRKQLRNAHFSPQSSTALLIEAALGCSQLMSMSSSFSQSFTENGWEHPFFLFFLYELLHTISLKTNIWHIFNRYLSFSMSCLVLITALHYIPETPLPAEPMGTGCRWRDCQRSCGGLAIRDVPATHGDAKKRSWSLRCCFYRSYGKKSLWLCSTL